VVGVESEYLLWTALDWAAVTSNQAGRVRASFEPYRTCMLSRIDVGVIRVMPEMERPEAIFWCDVHFLMIAVKHLDGVLKLLGTGAPRLDEGLQAKAIELGKPAPRACLSA
jgi:hypothetical protein